VLNTSLDQTFYSGLGAGYNTNYLLWNASVGYKFLKNKSLEVKASAFDLLKQNTSVSRNVTETYIEDTRTNTLQNYYMLTVTWNIKNYKKTANGGKGSSTEQPQTAPAGPPGPHPGNPPPGPPPGNKTDSTPLKIAHSPTLRKEKQHRLSFCVFIKTGDWNEGIFSRRPVPPAVLRQQSRCSSNPARRKIPV
jgi:hypothetical protein